MNHSKFWDIIVVRQDGEWIGFRTPFKSLKRTASLFGLLMVLCVLATSGWLVTRWKAHRLTMSLASEKLKAASLELQLNDIRSQVQAVPATGTEVGTNPALQSFTLIPSLDVEELTSPLIEVSEESAEYDSQSQDLSIKFEVARKPPRDGALRFYWVALLHGPQGLLSLPPALASRKGEPVLFHRGQALDDVKTRRSVNARFKISDFIDRAESEPMFVTLMVYDNKGTILTRQRLELFMRRANPRSGAKE